MGSYSSSSSINQAFDNRQAATDSALVFGQNTNSNLALGAPIFNLSAGAVSQGFGGGAYKGYSSASGGAAVGGTINLSILDGGAVNKSLDFAAFSLSQMLENIINQGRQQQETAEYTVDTIGNAIQQASKISAATAAAVAATETELNEKNQEFAKKAAVVAVAGALAWWVWKGK